MMSDPSVEEVDIVIASFGVISKLTTNKIYKLNMVRHIVLDEADALFHETFEEKLQIFLKRVPVCLHVDYTSNNNLHLTKYYVSKCNFVVFSSAMRTIRKIQNCQWAPC